jgi:hypothetical protein
MMLFLGLVFMGLHGSNTLFSRGVVHDICDVMPPKAVYS